MNSLSMRGFNTAYTADAVISASNGNRLFTNEGATGAVNITLPPARVNDRFIAYVKTAQVFSITPYGTDKIGKTDGSAMGGPGKSISADAVGEYIECVCFKDGEWTVIGYAGTWTNAA